MAKPTNSDRFKAWGLAGFGILGGIAAAVLVITVLNGPDDPAQPATSPATIDNPLVKSDQPSDEP